MSEERFLLVPWIDQKSGEPISKVDPSALEKLLPPLEELMPHCVPNPFAEAEIMSTILRARANRDSFKDVVTKEGGPLRQSWHRWQLLVKVLLLGELEVDQISLHTPPSDPISFPRALQQARNRRKFQGVLRSTKHLVPSGRKSRVVAGIEESALLWAAPRLTNQDWGILQTLISGTQEELALSILHHWRRMLDEQGLWGRDALPLPWMIGIDTMLDDRKPTIPWETLRRDVRMTGPVRLYFPQNNGDPVALDVYIPIYARGHAEQFERIFNLRPIQVEGSVKLVDDAAKNPATAKVGAVVRMSGGGESAQAGAIEDEFELLAGVGQVEFSDLRLARDRSWLEDRDGVPGYKSLAYMPLFEKVRRRYAAIGKDLKQKDIGTTPIFFPDAVGLAFPSFNLADGVLAVEYSELRNDFSSKIAAWVLPRTGVVLSDSTEDPGADKDLIIALGSTSSAPCLLERFVMNGQVVDVGELRALGAVLWEVYIGEAKIRNNGTQISRGSKDGEVIAALALPGRRTNFREPLLAAVGSVLIDRAGVATEYRRVVQKRRATAQRFKAHWQVRPAAITPEYLLARIAVNTFLNWAFKGADHGDLTESDGWGRVPDPVTEVAPGTTYDVIHTLKIPMSLDVYWLDVRFPQKQVRW